MTVAYFNDFYQLVKSTPVFCNGHYLSDTFVNVVLYRADVSIDVPDTLDLSALRATGQQPGEELLPEVAPVPLMTPDVEVKGILGSHGNDEDDSLYSPLLC